MGMDNDACNTIRGGLLLGIEAAFFTVYML